MPNLTQIAENFERINGTDAFLKTCIIIINKLLVEKGIVTPEELEEMFREEMSNE